MVRITHAVDFSAAHQLIAPTLSEEENRALFGPCYRLHGHNYRVEATVEGPVESETGMVMNLNDLAGLMRSKIWDHVDHQNLNEDVPFLQGVITTAENLAIAFWNQLEPHRDRFGSARLVSVRVTETPGNHVEYRGESR
ncbi:MAG: 6-carboxytetrahydropterin synthase [Planctomycetes bacterium]|nr:6-carboxytetrahydropterin synthase [Planctomycetota bacterium]